MVRCCVNPACRAEFRSLNTGNLYALEKRSADTEFFWLCSTCVPKVVLSLDPLRCVTVTSRSDTRCLQPPHPDGYLRLVAQRKPATPWHPAILAYGLMLSNGRDAPPSTTDPHKPSIYA